MTVNAGGISSQYLGFKLRRNVPAIQFESLHALSVAQLCCVRLKLDIPSHAGGCHCRENSKKPFIFIGLARCLVRLFRVLGFDKVAALPFPARALAGRGACPDRRFHYSVSSCVAGFWEKKPGRAQAGWRSPATNLVANLHKLRLTEGSAKLSYRPGLPRAAAVPVAARIRMKNGWSPRRMGLYCYKYWSTGGSGRSCPAFSTASV
jgi:hypothetical protein